jgi:hypothetical protein
MAFFDPIFSGSHGRFRALQVGRDFVRIVGHCINIALSQAGSGDVPVI